MSSRPVTEFILRAVVAGVVAAITVLYLLPEKVLPPHPVVELRTGGETANRPQGTGPVSYATAVRRAEPAVVNVYTSKTVPRENHPLLNDPMFRYFFGDKRTAPRKRTQNSLGSGVIISPQGYVLTNNHVIEEADEIHVILGDDRSLTARVVGVDLETDIAVLRIPAQNLPSIVVGDSEHLQVGDVVLAIGNPFGVGKTVTQGIVSATGRDHLNINPIENFIQTDAAINPGNSGGALINAYGELVGINTAIFSNSGGSNGVGFAIPASIAQDVLTQIVEHGRVIRGWLGVQAQDMTPQIAASFGLDSVTGVLITDVLQNGPAEQAGIRPGDILVTMNGEPLSTSKDAFRKIARYRPGETIVVGGIRNGTPYRQKVYVTERPNFR